MQCNNRLCCYFSVLVFVQHIAGLPTPALENKTVPALPPENAFLEDVYNEIIKIVHNESVAEPNKEVGVKLDAWSPGSGTNPEELGDYYEGDIVTQITDADRTGIIGEQYRWPHGVVPYHIETRDFSAENLKLLQEALDDYHRQTCIRFVPRTSRDLDYIRFQGEKTGCWSSVGRLGGMQAVNLQPPGCLFYVGTAIHEMMHVLGFYHEHSRPDRGDFINIVWPNIREEALSNFNTMPSVAFGVQYDYGSVMHYSAYAFSKNSEKTIVTRVPNTYIGQRLAFSPRDLQKIRAMYNCNIYFDTEGNKTQDTQTQSKTEISPISKPISIPKLNISIPKLPSIPFPNSKFSVLNFNQTTVRLGVGRSQSRPKLPTWAEILERFRSLRRKIQLVRK